MILSICIYAHTQFHAKLYDNRKRYDFDFVHIIKYTDCIGRSKIISSKLLNQGYHSDRLKVAINTICGLSLDLFGL